MSVEARMAQPDPVFANSGLVNTVTKAGGGRALSVPSTLNKWWKETSADGIVVNWRGECYGNWGWAETGGAWEEAGGGGGAGPEMGSCECVVDC